MIPIDEVERAARSMHGLLGQEQTPWDGLRESDKDEYRAEARTIVMMLNTDYRTAS